VINTILEVPIPGSDQKYRFDMSRCFMVEKQLEEIENLNIQKSNALLASLYAVSFDLISAMDTTSRLASKAKNRLAQRKAVITVDEMTAILKALGLTSNDTNRQGIIEKDAVYQKCLEEYDEISASEELLKLKFYKYEDAIRTVRSIAYNLVTVANRQNPNLNMALGQMDSETVGTSSEEIKNSMYGKAKYG